MSFSEEVRRRMGEYLGVAPPQLGDEAELTSLVPDSFGLVDMVIELQESFGIILHQEDLANVRTVGDLLKVVESKKAMGGQPNAV